MAIPTVSTLSVGSKLTATVWNEIVTAFTFALAPPECIAVASSTVSVTNTTITLVTMDAEDVDTGGTWDGAMHDTATNNSRVYATTAGRYDMRQVLDYSNNTTGTRLAHMRLNAGGSSAGGTSLNSTSVRQNASSGSALTEVQRWKSYDLAAGDYVEQFAYQDSGSTLTVTGNLQVKLVGS